MKTITIIFALVMLSGCWKTSTEKKIELGESIIEVYHTVVKLKRDRNNLIKALIECHDLDTLTWVTAETVDSLIEVVKKQPRKGGYFVLKNPVGDTVIIAQSNSTYIGDDWRVRDPLIDTGKTLVLPGTIWITVNPCDTTGFHNAKHQ